MILHAVQDAFTIIKLVLWVPVGKGNGYFQGDLCHFNGSSGATHNTHHVQVSKVALQMVVLFFSAFISM